MTNKYGVDFGLDLKQETQESIDGLDYTILSDADINAGMAFGLAFRSPDETVNSYKQRHWNLASSSIEKHKVLSIPAVYVIRANGEIAYAHIAAFCEVHKRRIF